MSTTTLFNNMLNEYLAVDLLKQELKKQDYFMQKVDMDEGAKGGTVPVPFEGQYASSVQFGSLADITDISSYKYVRGTLAPTVEAWGSLIFNHRDLMNHDGKVNEKSFLKILPGQITDFVNTFRSALSVNCLNGSSFATLTVDGTNLGVMEVDRVERFALDQKIELRDNNTADATYYVIGVDVNGGTLGLGTVTVSASRGGAAADISAYTVSQAAKVYQPGAFTAPFTSIKSQLLSLSNGGPALLFGQPKTAYSYLQATQIDGSTVSATNILSKIFQGAARRQQIGRGSGNMEIICSYKHMGSILTQLEVGGGTPGTGFPAKGAYNVVQGSRKVSAFGWQEVTVGSPNGDLLKIVAILDMDNDWIWYCDWDSVKMFTNGGLQRRTAPDGLQYYQARATTGFVYILDHVLVGDVAVLAPWKHAIMHDIPNY